MEKYLQQLIEDLRQAALRVPPPREIWDPVDMDSYNEVADMLYIEDFIHGIPRPLSNIVGIDKIYFPHPDKLSPQQVNQLYAEMEKLINAYHFFPDYPTGLPVSEKYRLLRQEWDSGQVFVGAGEVHIEFCTYDEHQCPFPAEFCACRNQESQEKEQLQLKGKMNQEEDDDKEVPH